MHYAIVRFEIMDQVKYYARGIMDLHYYNRLVTYSIYLLECNCSVQIMRFFLLVVVKY